MAEEPFEIIEHTADVGIVARGATLEELFANAAAALFALMVDLPGVEEHVERRVEAAAQDWGGLLVRWLSELLYYVDAEELLFRRFQIQELKPFRLVARAFGEAIDRERHQFHFGVKAVTKHMLEVRQEDGHWRAQVLFDI